MSDRQKAKVLEAFVQQLCFILNALAKGTKKMQLDQCAKHRCKFLGDRRFTELPPPPPLGQGG